jgi:hypothetical protein
MYGTSKAMSEAVDAAQGPLLCLNDGARTVGPRIALSVM